MPHPVSLSKSKLLALCQCPRRLWLEQYSPELAEESAETEARFQTGRVVGEHARQVYGKNGAHHVDNQRGLRSAVAQTSELIEAGGTEPIFEATFDHDGLTVQVDILDRSDGVLRIVEVKSSTKFKPYHLDDCAIQAWVLEQLGQPLGQVVLAHINNEFVCHGDGNHEGLFAEDDLTEQANERFEAMPELIAQARATLASLDEPDVAVGPHCDSPYGCPFYTHCAPPQGKYPVFGLGGRKKKLYEIMHAGYEDLRDVPEALLSSDTQRRIQQQSRLDEAFVGQALAKFEAELPYPRYYLDFETIGFAVPIWNDTRPYEALPFQWSCHVDHGEGGLDHEEFLDLSGEPPMCECARQLIETLGTAGPVLVYTSYEQRVINALAARYPEFELKLKAIGDRLVDLHPVTKAHYYHPDMLGSWSIKSVLPTVAPKLDYGELGEVRNGDAAQTAYLEAIKPETSASRRERLRQDLLDYCRYDTLALVELVKFFRISAVESI